MAMSEQEKSETISQAYEDGKSGNTESYGASCSDRSNAHETALESAAAAAYNSGSRDSGGNKH